MASFTNLFTVEIHYGGYFDQCPHKRYINGKIHLMDNIDEDEIFLEVIMHVMSNLGYGGGFRVFCNMHGKSLQDGLRLCYDSKTFYDAFQEHKYTKKVVLYIENLSEELPTVEDVENEEQINEVGFTNFGDSNEDNCTDSSGEDDFPYIPNKIIQSDREDFLTGSRRDFFKVTGQIKEGKQMGTRKENLASSKVDLCRELTEHAYEDLDRDEEQHRPLEDIITENVEINFVPIPEVESEYEGSDTLRSLVDSDDEHECEDRYPNESQFNINEKPMLETGMKFTDNKAFRKALQQYAILSRLQY